MFHLAQAPVDPPDPTALGEYGIGFFALAILWVVLREIVIPLVKRRTSGGDPAPAAPVTPGVGGDIWNLEDRRIQDHETRLRAQELQCVKTRTNHAAEVKAIRKDVGEIRLSQDKVATALGATQETLTDLLSHLALE